MANPQKENGYAPIANEILDEIQKLNLNGTQFRILLAIWRYTYGFNRKEAELSNSFIARSIKSSRPAVSREIKILLSMNIITKVKDSSFGKAAILKFNKNYDEWRIEVDTCIESDTYRVRYGERIEVDTEKRIYVDTEDKQYIKQKENKEDFSSFFESVWKLYPHKKGKDAVSTKAKKELQKAGYDTIAKSIEKYANDKPSWQNYMNGSTFFNGRWREFAETDPQDESSQQNNNEKSEDCKQWQL